MKNTIVKATIIWWSEDKQWECIAKSREQANNMVDDVLKEHPANEETEVIIRETMYDYEEKDEETAFVEAVLNKDGPNAHSDSMFAMKYSDKF